ncbi:MAG: translation initiation factor IF-2, partial [Planctomycetota bacterium]
LESEVLELKCHLEGPASGIVLEAEIQQGKGKVAHLLIQDGSLKKGDVILAGEGYGRVRSIHDDRGNLLDEAGPSMPVEVTGLNELPTVGDHFYVVDELEKATDVATERARASRQLSQIERRAVSQENILQAVADAAKPTINLIVKADKQGSVEVLKHQVGLFLHAEMQINLLHAGVGAVTESDVDLATTSGARILAFHTSANSRVRQMAERGGVEIKIYEVLYDLLEDIKRLMEGELAPEVREEVTGHAEVRRVFKSSKFGNISGCFVIDGSLFRSSQARLLRDSSVVYTGAIGSLRREKDDVREVREGFECGITLKDFDDVRENDVIEAFKVVEVKRSL